MAAKIPLIIPVENQVRELDPKLFLACIAAQRGFPVYIGSRREIHFHITSFPRGVYLSKSITGASDMMFGIMRNLGHEVVAWDEEALVHLPDDIYFSRRLSPKAMAQVSHFFAWGEDNAELWQRYPHMPEKAEIHVTGNPRNDLLRPELHAYYDDEVIKIRQNYGDFILINTNFNHVNAFTPVQNLFQPIEKDGHKAQFGRAAKGMTREYAQGLKALKESVFADFKTMIPEIDKAFPDHNIIVRPHPTEDPKPYKDIASKCLRVTVTNEGNVVPWLLATKALIHNGCTTGVEAYVMKVPAITYRVSVSEKYDMGFYRLPNTVSLACFSLEELKSTLKRILNGSFNPKESSDCREIVTRHLAAVDGPFACERIVDVIENMFNNRSVVNKPLGGRLSGWTKWAGRTLVKKYKDSRPGSHNRPEFQKHRYPELSINDVTSRIDKFQHLLGSMQRLKIEKFLNQFFIIKPEFSKMN